MSTTFKDLTNYLVNLGTADIGHSEKSYLAHAIGVYNIMKEWGCSEALCNAALFHSIAAYSSGHMHVKSMGQH